jgi:hypothetical protein
MLSEIVVNYRDSCPTTEMYRVQLTHILAIVSCHASDLFHSKEG